MIILRAVARLAHKRPVGVDARPVLAELRERCVASLDLIRKVDEGLGQVSVRAEQRPESRPVQKPHDALRGPVFQGLDVGVQASEFMVQGSWFREMIGRKKNGLGLGLRVEGLGFRVCGLGFGV